MARVLVVDDETGLANTICRILELDDHEVAAVDNSEEAMALMFESEFDVVVTDIIMPRTSGLELLGSINEHFPHIKVILITGEPDVNTASEAVRRGAYDYLSKPVDNNAIRTAVQSAAANKELEEKTRRSHENLEHIIAERMDRLKKVNDRLSREVRDRRRSDESRKRTITFFESVLEASRDGIVITDFSRTIIDTNTAFCSIFDRELAEVKRTYIDLWIEQLKDGAKEKWSELEQSVEQEGFAQNFEFSTQDPEGRHLDVNASIVERVGFEESAVIISIWRDITEQKVFERALLESREHLKHLAMIDELTGISNRRKLLEDGDREFHRAQRYERSLSVLMLDIDHFKKVNDTFGHQAGDEALRKVTRTCQLTLRKNDLFGRLGGEEFAVILPEASQEAAVETAERMRQDVSSMVIQTLKGEVTLTLSIGVSSIAEKVSNFEELLNNADRAMYQAKSGGRNRVEIKR